MRCAYRALSAALRGLRDRSSHKERGHRSLLARLVDVERQAVHRPRACGSPENDLRTKGIAGERRCEESRAGHGGRSASIATIEAMGSVLRIASLPAAEMRAAADRDRTVRLEGGRNLQNAARAADARRYIVQSTGFFYAPGPGLATETESLTLDASPAVSASVQSIHRSNSGFSVRLIWKGWVFTLSL